MAYPQLGTKIDVLQKKYRIDISAISIAIKKDKSTAWRWLQKAGKLKPEQQDQLVAAICHSLTASEAKLSPSAFMGNDVLAFCRNIGCSKLEAAIYSGLSISVPDIFLDGLFRPATNPDAFVGYYRLFRHDKDRTRSDAPYIQAFASIRNDNNQRLIYEDHWAGDKGDWSYEGFLFPMGNVTNIVGQRKTTEFNSTAEMFWCGLHGKAGGNGSAVEFRGYVSDLTKGGKIFADRILLVRVDEKSWSEGRNAGEYFIQRAKCVEYAGEDGVKFVDEWIDVSV